MMPLEAHTGVNVQQGSMLKLLTMIQVVAGLCFIHKPIVLPFILHMMIVMPEHLTKSFYEGQTQVWLIYHFISIILVLNAQHVNLVEMYSTLALISPNNCVNTQLFYSGNEHLCTKELIITQCTSLGALKILVFA